MVESCEVCKGVLINQTFVAFRQNAIELEEKEKREKELLIQIIEEADEFKIDFYQKRKITCENNKAANREREKVRSNELSERFD